MTKDSSAVIAHVNMMQNVIKRMAINSASCKQWCIVTITALIAYSNNLPETIGLAKASLVPLMMFCFLDCYYLGLERQMRKLFNGFVAKMNKSENIDTQVYVVGTPIESVDFCERFKGWLNKEITQLYNTLKALLSFSTFPFYGAIFILCRIIA